MCLFTKQICPLRACKDIVCYKVIIRLSECLFRTPHQCYTIQGKLPITLQIDDTQRIEQEMSIYPRCFKIFGGMFHAYTKLDRAVIASLMSAKPHSVIIKCTIPKGTLYYKGVNGDICARTLILQEICGNQDNL